MLPTQSRAFFAVANAGSFTAAARALNVSQPTLTTQVKALEMSYGVELFFRHPRGVTLTNSGRKLLVIIRRIQTSQQDAIEYLHAVRKLDTGHIRIGSYGPFDIMDILSEFSNYYPKLTYSLEFANSRQLHDNLLNYNLDAAIFFKLEKNPQFYSVSLKKLKQVLIVGKSHPLNFRKPIHIKDLKGERLIIREPGSEVRRATETVFQNARLKMTKVIEVSNREGVIAAVARGIGISIIFDEGLNPHDAVNKLDIIGANIAPEVDIVCMTERKSNPIISSFFKTAERLLNKASNRVIQNDGFNRLV